MDDPELERIRHEQLREMLARQSATVEELDGAGFDAAISRNRLVLVDFWAEWCGPCKSMHPVFERLSKKYHGIRFARLNVDAAKNIAARYAVQSIPTFIMFQDGREAQRMVGAVGEPGIHMIAKKFLGTS